MDCAWARNTWNKAICCSSYYYEIQKCVKHFVYDGSGSFFRPWGILAFHGNVRTIIGGTAIAFAVRKRRNGIER